MTDRELLEAAAKADGSPTWNGPSNCFELNGFYWSPLESDGDALRLAVKLGLSLDFEGAYARANGGEFITSQEIEPKGDDPCAATRRAIVSAAANISTKEK
jgi:hypothetical protein